MRFLFCCTFLISRQTATFLAGKNRLCFFSKVNQWGPFITVIVVIFTHIEFAPFIRPSSWAVQTISFVRGVSVALFVIFGTLDPINFDHYRWMLRYCHYFHNLYPRYQHLALLIRYLNSMLIRYSTFYTYFQFFFRCNRIISGTWKFDLQCGFVTGLWHEDVLPWQIVRTINVII